MERQIGHHDGLGGGVARPVAEALREGLADLLGRHVAGQDHDHPVGAVLAAMEADQIVARPSDAAHVLYDGALLVSREREADLGNVVRQWQPRLAPVGCRVSLTGPWPPYSFVSLDGRR